MFTTRVCHINVALPDVTLRPVKGVMEQRPRPAIQLNQIAAIPIILEQVINELDPRFPKVQSMMLRVAKNKRDVNQAPSTRYTSIFTSGSVNE